VVLFLVTVDNNLSLVLSSPGQAAEAEARAKGVGL